MNRLDGLIAEAIESTGSEVLGTRVSVGSVTTNINNGTASVREIAIANAPTFNDALALSIPEVSAEVNYASQTIESILIAQPVIYAEIIGRKNNFQALREQMPGADDSVQDESEELKLTINALKLTAATINLRITEPDLGERTFVMDDFTMTNLYGTVDELSDEILVALTNHVSSQISRYARVELTKRATKAITDEIKEKLSDKLKDLGL